MSIYNNKCSASIECMLVGYYDYDFDAYVESLKVGGAAGVSYRDANLSFVTHRGKRLRALDFLNAHGSIRGQNGGPLDNGDFLWPVITYLGTFLNRRGVSFDYVRLFHQDKSKLEDALRRHAVRTVAITTTVYVTPEPIIQIVDFVRRIDSSVKIIVGGPYLASQPKILDNDSLDELLDYIGADYYVFSAEGEATLVELLKAIGREGGFDKINNLAFRTGNGFRKTFMAPEGNSLEENMVDYGLFPRADIGQFVTVRTAKSCPFACAFCGFPERAGKYKYLALDYVEQELDRIRDIGGVTTVTFIDDTFNVPKGRFKDILKLMIRKDYGFKWNSYLRCDHVDDEALLLMAESGCEGVFLGVESGSERILKNMAKTSRPPDYRRVIGRCRELGILTYASLIVGFPGEDAGTIQESIDLLQTARPDFFRAQVWYADPITPIFRNGAEYDLQGEAFGWTHRTMDALTAADYVEEMFLTVRGSRWLPQNGFEPWSLYYLQRHGLTISQINAFLDAFNGGIRDKLLTNSEALSDANFAAMLRCVQNMCEPEPSLGAMPLVLADRSRGSALASPYTLLEKR